VCCSGLAASTVIEEGQTLCSIPFSLVVSTALAEQTLGGGHDVTLPAQLQLQPEVLLLAAFLMQQRRSANSKWAKWLESLPALETFGSTYFWSQEELSELQSSQLAADTVRRKERVKHDFDILVPFLAGNVPQLEQELVESADSWELWLWALSNVWSRSFYLELPEGEDHFRYSQRNGQASTGDKHGCLMLPYCDYINHSDRPTGFKIDYGAEEITLVATQGYQAAEQVMDCYGPKPNATLLLNYGFVTPNNRHDSVVLCVKQPAAESEDPELAAVKQQLLAGHHLGSTLHCPVTAADLLPAELLAFLRIAHLDSVAEAQSEAGKLRGADRPFNLLNESRALKSLLRLAQGKLSQNPTTQVEDDELLAQMGDAPDNYRTYCAVVQRRSEKNILNRFCSALKERMRQTIMFFTMKNEMKDKGKGTPSPSE